MFAITSTRIVGLIAVVCAAIVAPQALAMPIIDSQDATPTIIAPPDPGQGHDLSGLDLSVLNGIRGYEHQDQYLKGLALAALAGGTTKSVKVQPESQWRSPLGQPANNTPGGIVRASKSGTAASTAAAIDALQRRSVALDAAYRKLYPGAYRQTVQNMPTNPGWGAAATEAKKSASQTPVKTAPVVCLGQAEYDYVYSGCEWWS
jgi:cell division septation protein DedD